MWRAKLSQTLIVLKGGRATLPYPAAPHPPAAGFRGLPALDADLCLGCGACVNACPSRLLTLTDGPDVITLTADFARCVYCARCADVCPTAAIAMTDRFESAVTNPGALRAEVRLPAAVCPSCGAPLGDTQAMVRYARDLTHLPETALCPTCKRRRQAALLKGGRSRG
jgi:formate hydrogenlyase subunit 6/NADH:ubiquinone oxidoreductase subunit I